MFWFIISNGKIQTISLSASPVGKIAEKTVWRSAFL